MGRPRIRWCGDLLISFQYRCSLHMGFRFVLIFSMLNLHTTGLSTLYYSTIIENTAACTTNKARTSPYSILAYNALEAITLSYSLTN